MGTSLERHQWLEDARDFCVNRLAEVACNVPKDVRITIGFPSTGGRGKRIGECCFPEGVSDSQHEVCVSPALGDSTQILGVLIHELIHTAVGPEAKHGKAFRDPARAVGLEGKMTATTVGEALKGVFAEWIKENGEYPGGAINVSSHKKQATRLLKAECETCGYLVRVTAKWVDAAGPPHCPDHGAMTVDGYSETDPTNPTDPEDDPPEPEDEPEDEPKDDNPPDPVPEPKRASVKPGDQGEAHYLVTQSDEAHERSEALAVDDRAAAEAQARRWSKTGQDKTATVSAIKGGKEIGHKHFHAGLSTNPTGDYPI